MGIPENAVVFVTGCSSGLGAAFCTYAHAQGWCVVATARKPSSLSYLPDGPSVLKLALDVTSDSSVDAAFKAALDKFGRIDIFVNNAGYTKMGITEAIPDEEMRAIMETCFWGSVRCTKRVVPIMREINPKTGSIGGTIVQISSMGGRLTLPGGASYHAAKWALEGYTESISQEVDPTWNIRLMIVEPGGTGTNFTGGEFQNIRRHPAYKDPNLPVNQMFAMMQGPDIGKYFAKAEDVVKIIFDTVAKEKIPLRLPTGKDSWAAIKGKDTAKMQELDEWKEVSESAGAVAFM